MRSGRIFCAPLFLWYIFLMIIDTHVHVYPPEVIEDWERIASREDYFETLVRSRVHKWCTAGDVLNAMDADGVDESWITTFGFKDLGLCRLCNDYAIEMANASGGRLKAMAVVPPTARGAASEIERCAASGVIGIGEIFPDGQNFDVSDPDETWRFAAVCHETEMFVMIHTAEPVGRNYPGKGMASPSEAYAFARNHPELRIVMAHWGGGLFLYESTLEARVALKNVRYDTAASPFVYGREIFDLCALPWLRGKIMYGSDFPLLRYPRYKSQINESVLEENLKDFLMYRSAMIFLEAQ